MAALQGVLHLFLFCRLSLLLRKQGTTFLPLSLCSFASEDLAVDLFYPLRVFDYSALTCTSYFEGYIMHNDFCTQYVGKKQTKTSCFYWKKDYFSTWTHFPKIPIIFINYNSLCQFTILNTLQRLLL